MSAPATHTVPGVEGQRKSPRVYTHAVVAQRDLASDIARARRGASNMAGVNWGYHVKVASGTSRFSHTDKEIEYAKEVVAMGLDAHKALCADEAEASLRAYHKSAPGVVQWSMSENNARKSVGTFQKRGFVNVEVCAVVRVAKGEA